MDPSTELIPNSTFCRKDMDTPSRPCCPSVLISRPRMGRAVLVRIPSCFSKLYVTPRASISTSQPQHAGRCQIHGYICSGSNVRDHPRVFLGILTSLAFNFLAFLLGLFPWGKNRDPNWEIPAYFSPEELQCCLFPIKFGQNDPAGSRLDGQTEGLSSPALIPQQTAWKWLMSK